MMDDLDQNFDLKKKNSSLIPKTSDKRREISRDAARQRRNNESDIFLKLQEVVPIVDEPKVSHVDRIALLRLAASYIRFRHIASKILTNGDDNNRKMDISIELSDCFSESKIGELLNGFLLIVDSSGFIIYASASVSKFLGVTQASDFSFKSRYLHSTTDLVGHNLSEFLKDDDLKEMLDVISRCQDNVQEKTFLRMKSVLGARGRSLNLRSALYKTISFSVVKRYVSMDHNICDLSDMSLSSSSTTSSLIENQTTPIVELKTMNNAGDQDENSDESVRTTPDIDFDNNNNELNSSALKYNENVSTKSDANCGKKSRRKKQKTVTSDGHFYFFVGSTMNQCGNSVETYCSHRCNDPGYLESRFWFLLKMFLNISSKSSRIIWFRLTEYLGYDVKALSGLSFYSLVHPLDLRKLQEDFKQSWFYINY
uniref:Uncharacterized protein n=1 Tax=Romanomermis culicivorax TaxID=13658 RepID=A0A915IVS7_ROMCU